MATTSAAPAATAQATPAHLEFQNKGPPEIAPHEITYFEKIGGGCFGTVHRGLCRGKEVAVKKLFRQDLTTKTLEDFKKEVEICSRLHHPNVVLFMGACTTTGHMAIVTELMPKGNLQAVLHDNNLQLSLYRRIKFAKDAALGLNWLHRSNPQIVHRDLKPSNLLLDNNFTVKVCDFGLSAVKSQGQTIKDKDCIPGTPLWMAPEVMLGQPLDEKSDVYSYGIVVWEIVTSQEPFLEYDSYPAFKRAICREDVRPPIPKDTLPSLKKLLEDCWDKDPKKRPSFDEIINRLDEIIIDATISDPTGRAFWKKHFFGKEVVLYKDFVKPFAELFHLQPTPDDLNFECLKAILPLKDSDPTLRDPPLVVNIERFGHTLEFFGPLAVDPAQPSTNLLERIKATMKQPWFHGDITTAEAEKLLNTQKKGHFLVRLSTSQAGCFTISKVSRSGGISHQRIDYKPDKGFSLVLNNSKKGKRTVQDTVSLQHLIESVKTELYLKAPCPGSPYESIFTRSKSKLDGYLIFDSDGEDD